jgi:hypothetical protein
VTNFGQNSTFEIVARAQHEEDMRRAAEYRLVREAQPQRKPLGLIWKLFGLLAVTDEKSFEAISEPSAQTAA